ncbi:hypothetical protein ACQY0O_003305 [Thecaphora frezii]
MASIVPQPKPALVRSEVSTHFSDPPSWSYHHNEPLFPLTPEEIAAIKLVGDENPQRWPESRKWLTTIVISLMGFVSPLGSSILVPGDKYLHDTFHLTERALSLLPISLFVLGLGFGPFILAPLSELKGRMPMYVSTSLLFVALNLASSFSQTFVALNVLRFFAGAAGSAGPSLGAGSIGDLFEPRERGRAQALYGLGPLMGPVVGNLIGGFIAQGDRDWRWLLFTVTIMSMWVFVAIILFLKETYAPVLLRKKRQRAIRERLELIRQQNPEAIAAKQLHLSLASRIKAWSAKLHPSPEARAKIRQAQSRPFRLLFTNPICAIFSFYLGFCYGIIFLFLTQHPLLFQKREPGENLPKPERLPTYNWTLGNSGLSYIGLGLGFLASAATCVLVQDELYQRLVLTDGRVCKLLLRDRIEIARVLEEQRLRGAAAADEGERDVEKQADAATSKKDDDATSEEATPDATDVKGGDEAIENIVPAASPAHCAATDLKEKAAATASADTKAHVDGDVAKPNASPAPKKGRPEFRLPLCFIGMLILPCGLLCFGWAAESKAHWTVPLLGSLLVGYATILCFQTILIYLVDAFVPYSASATACAVLVRSILAAVLPIAGEYMLRDMGYGWTSTLLALMALVGAPVPLVLFRYGERLRSRYKFHG